MKIVGDKAYIKIVFFGTALAGKTTILEWLFQNAIPDEMKLVKELRQVKTSFGQTLLFDFAPIQVADGLVARMFTSTGQDYYRGTRPNVLSGADGIFLVVDSQKNELEHNRELVTELKKYMREIDGLDQAELVALYNKQDMDDVYSMEYLEEELGLKDRPGFATNAIDGESLTDSLLTMLKRISARLREQGYDLF